MSLAFFLVSLVLTVAQVIFWRYLGETFNYAASVSVFGLSAALTVILAAIAALMSDWRPGRG